MPFVYLQSIIKVYGNPIYVEPIRAHHKNKNYEYYTLSIIDFWYWFIYWFITIAETGDVSVIVDAILNVNSNMHTWLIVHKYMLPDK